MTAVFKMDDWKDEHYDFDKDFFDDNDCLNQI